MVPLIRYRYLAISVKSGVTPIPSGFGNSLWIFFRDFIEWSRHITDLIGIWGCSVLKYIRIYDVHFRDEDIEVYCEHFRVF